MVDKTKHWRQFFKALPDGLEKLDTGWRKVAGLVWTVMGTLVSGIAFIRWGWISGPSILVAVIALSLLVLAITNGGELHEKIYGGDTEGLTVSTRKRSSKSDVIAGKFETTVEFWLRVANSSLLKEVLLEIHTDPETDTLPGLPEGTWNVKWLSNEINDGFVRVGQEQKPQEALLMQLHLSFDASKNDMPTRIKYFGEHWGELEADWGFDKTYRQELKVRVQAHNPNAVNNTSVDYLLKLDIPARCTDAEMASFEIEKIPVLVE